MQRPASRLSATLLVCSALASSLLLAFPQHAWAQG